MSSRLVGPRWIPGRSPPAIRFDLIWNGRPCPIPIRLVGSRRSFEGLVTLRGASTVGPARSALDILALRVLRRHVQREPTRDGSVDFGQPAICHRAEAQD